MASTDENSILLARIEERLKNIEKEVTVVRQSIKELKSQVDTDFFQLDKRVREQYITKDTFLPVQRAMFTAMTTIVAAVVMAVLNFTFK